jgi:exodeoxyribonuclease-3
MEAAELEPAELRWFERLTEHAGRLLASGAPAVLAGDYNVMPADIDVYAPERWVDDALFRPEVREAFRRLVAQGWTDALWALHPDERIYTFWKYFRNAFARDAGLRIDHLLVSPSIGSRLVAAGVDREVRGREHASDHAPAWIEIALDRGARGRCPATADGVAVSGRPLRRAAGASIVRVKLSHLQPRRPRQ